MFMPPNDWSAPRDEALPFLEDAVCDWIEASVVFDDESLSITDVVDLLTDEGLIVEQNVARRLVNNCWQQFERRHAWNPEGLPLGVHAGRLTRTAPWEENAPAAFCLLLSVARFYDWWHTEFGPDYTEQGALFELVTAAAMRSLFPGWQLYETGWSRSNTQGLGVIVGEVAQRMGEMPGDLSLWNNTWAKEQGLDLLGYRPFPDRRTGIPAYLIQCASGKHWHGKLKTPDLDVWRKMLNPTVLPSRGFSIPFCLSDREFSQSSNIVNGLFLDRSRLLMAGHGNRWLPDGVAERIVRWATPRIEIVLARSR